MNEQLFLVSTFFNYHIRKMEMCYGYVYLSKRLMNKKSGIVKSMWIFEKSARTNVQFT